jgi:hypothetical protein
MQMRFHIMGAHRESGDDVELLIESENEESVNQTMAGMNLMVEKLEPATMPLHTDIVKYEYHTLRCDFRDLNVHLNKYAEDYWRIHNIHHDPHDDKMVRVVMERIHRVDTASKF